MRDFQDVTRDCSLNDMKFCGPLFTWCNKKTMMSLFVKKLDRVLINDQWIVEYQKSCEVFEAGVALIIFDVE